MESEHADASNKLVTKFPLPNGCSANHADRRTWQSRGSSPTSLLRIIKFILECFRVLPRRQIQCLEQTCCTIGTNENERTSAFTQHAPLSTIRRMKIVSEHAGPFTARPSSCRLRCPVPVRSRLNKHNHAEIAPIQLRIRCMQFALKHRSRSMRCIFYCGFYFDCTSCRCIIISADGHSSVAANMAEG